MKIDHGYPNNCACSVFISTVDPTILLSFYIFVNSLNAVLSKFAKFYFPAWNMSAIRFLVFARPSVTLVFIAFPTYAASIVSYLFNQFNYLFSMKLKLPVFAAFAIAAFFYIYS